jgi:hypothetical protein
LGWADREGERKIWGGFWDFELFMILETTNINRKPCKQNMSATFIKNLIISYSKFLVKKINIWRILKIMSKYLFYYSS